LQGSKELEAHSNHEYENHENDDKVFNIEQDLEDDIDEWGNIINKTQEISSLEEEAHGSKYSYLSE
jgi:hypothetical protein